MPNDKAIPLDQHGQEMLEQLIASHRAMDWLLGQLITAKQDFMPSQSPVWPTVHASHKLITELGGKI